MAKNKTLADWGLRHISHSSLDLALNEMPAWVAQYLFKKRRPMGAAAVRGQAVEIGVKIMHDGGEFDDPLTESLAFYNKNTRLGIDGDTREKEAGHIQPMLEQYQKLHGIDEWDGTIHSLPNTEASQRRIELELPGIGIPLIGYTDFEFEDSIVDLKTTTRMPSAISASHRRQGAIYQRASGNRRMDFIYLTPKKAARYTLENSEQEWAEVCTIARKLQNFLAAFETREAVADVLMPNYGHPFYWKDPIFREAGREIFGI